MQDLSKNWIVAEVCQKGSNPLLLIGVYGDPHRIENPRIWAQLEHFMERQHLEVCLVGNFNAVASASEKWEGGVKIYPKKMWPLELG